MLLTTGDLNQSTLAPPRVVEAIAVLPDEETTLLGQNLQTGSFLAFFLLDGHLKPKLSDHGLKNLVSFGEGFHAGASAHGQIEKQADHSEECGDAPGPDSQTIDQAGHMETH